MQEGRRRKLLQVMFKTRKKTCSALSEATVSQGVDECEFRVVSDNKNSNKSSLWSDSRTPRTENGMKTEVQMVTCAHSLGRRRPIGKIRCDKLIITMPVKKREDCKVLLC